MRAECRRLNASGKPVRIFNGKIVPTQHFPSTSAANAQSTMGKGRHSVEQPRREEQTGGLFGGLANALQEFVEKETARE